MENNNRPPVILMNMAVNVIGDKECDTLKSDYAYRVSESGAVPMLIPSIENHLVIENLLDIADGVLFVGGKDYPPEYYNAPAHPETRLNRLRPHFDIAFAQSVLKRQIPVLGICAGCQLLNIVTGGKLVQHLPNAEEHLSTVHTATLERGGFFSRAAGLVPGAEFTVNSFHHQAVDPENTGENVLITARAFDGSVEVIELDIPGRMVMGVQFHPERMSGNISVGLFNLLRDEAIKYRRSKG